MMEEFKEVKKAKVLPLLRIDTDSSELNKDRKSQKSFTRILIDISFEKRHSLEKKNEIFENLCKGFAIKYKKLSECENALNQRLKSQLGGKAITSSGREFSQKEKDSAAILINFTLKRFEHSEK